MPISVAAREARCCSSRATSSTPRGTRRSCILILWLSTVVDWFVARWHLQRAHAARRGRSCSSAWSSTSASSGTSSTAASSSRTSQVLAGALGIDFHPATARHRAADRHLVLHVRDDRYTIDVYLRRMQADASFLDFALFVTFFPHLVAGPIVRPPIVPQFEAAAPATAGRCVRPVPLVSGCSRRSCSPTAAGADRRCRVRRRRGARAPWCLDRHVAFAGQIFCDFAGYSTSRSAPRCASASRCRDNFRSPYAAVGFSDFWRRWHISLSTWLRDYLYIPLGGNRRGDGADLRQPDAHDAARRALARRQLDVRRLGRDPRVLSRARARWCDGSPAGVGRDRVRQFALALCHLRLVCVAWVFFRARRTTGRRRGFTLVCAGSSRSPSATRRTHATP